tara:strand:+ start:256 stop:402 length:147 start_codon:yes stop_codon:yes gene_type:complete
MNNNNTFYTDKEIRYYQNIAVSAFIKFQEEYPKILINKYMEIIRKKSK